MQYALLNWIEPSTTRVKKNKCSMTKYNISVMGDPNARRKNGILERIKDSSIIIIIIDPYFSNEKYL